MFELEGLTACTAALAVLAIITGWLTLTTATRAMFTHIAKGYIREQEDAATDREALERARRLWAVRCPQGEGEKAPTKAKGGHKGKEPVVGRADLENEVSALRGWAENIYAELLASAQARYATDSRELRERWERSLSQTRLPLDLVYSPTINHKGYYREVRAFWPVLRAIRKADRNIQMPTQGKKNAKIPYRTLWGRCCS